MLPTGQLRGGLTLLDGLLLMVGAEAGLAENLLVSDQRHLPVIVPGRDLRLDEGRVEEATSLVRAEVPDRAGDDPLRLGLVVGLHVDPFGADGGDHERHVQEVRGVVMWHTERVEIILPVFFQDGQNAQDDQNVRHAGNLGGRDVAAVVETDADLLELLAVHDLSPPRLVVFQPLNPV